MKLNKAQKIVIIIALFVMTIMTLFPPVAEIRFESTHKIFIPKGWGFLFLLPGYRKYKIATYKKQNPLLNLNLNTSYIFKKLSDLQNYYDKIFPSKKPSSPSADLENPYDKYYNSVTPESVTSKIVKSPIKHKNKFTEFYDSTHTYSTRVDINTRKLSFEFLAIALLGSALIALFSLKKREK